jgi:hypothetical protein
MADCLDCNKSFARNFQGLIQDVCYLKDIALVDKFVRVSEDDTGSGYLSDKLIGVSGISFFELPYGVSGHTYVASLDVNFFDNRYFYQPSTILLGLNEGNVNGYVYYNRISEFNIQSLSFKNCGNGSSSWNFRVPYDFSDDKNTNISLRWAVNDSVSGIVLFNIKYNSISVNNLVGMFYEEIVSGIGDGVALKMNEVTLNINSSFITTEDEFFIKVTRLSNHVNDSIDGPVELLGINFNYNL